MTMTDEALAGSTPLVDQSTSGGAVGCHHTSADEGCDDLSLAVQLRPGTSNLLRLVATLHGRRATVRALEYETESSRATAVLSVSLPQGMAHHVTTKVAQLIEVLDVTVLHDAGQQDYHPG